MKTERQATTHRATSETDITVTLDLDGSGKANIDTGIGFFDHMLTALSKHSLIDLSVKVQGDLHIDGHHTVEDTGIAIGQTLRQALSDKRGVRRFGHALVPLDEALCEAVVDLSGRPFLAFDATFDRDRIGEMDTELVEEFFRAFAMSGLLTLHLTQKAGKNCHHIAEAGLKALARALRMAVEADPRAQDAIPSTKGKL